jgi:hypothetical protein
MADITVTAANVAMIAGTSPTGVKEDVTAGATITAGMAVYKDTSDADKYKPCDADVKATASWDGIATNSASDGQPLRIQKEGTINLGATLVLGKTYCVSTTGGGIAPDADIASGDFKSVIGVAITTANLKIGKINSGVAVP